MGQSEARRNRRLANRDFMKKTKFIATLNIPDTYVKICLNLDHGLSDYKKHIFMYYIKKRRELDLKFNEVMSKLDNMISESLKNKLKDTVNE